MKIILLEIKTALIVTLVTALILCVAYPLVVWGGATVLFPKQANGSLVLGSDGKPRGSSLLGQNFSGPRYFHPRPSSAGANGYDGASSGGSNLGPTSQKLADAIKSRVEQYRTTNFLAPNAEVPADAVTASGSGLDPHISVRNAGLQAPRVAKERGLTLDQVTGLIRKHIEGPDLGILGQPGVNVLLLNIDLDQLAL
jgi:K+-transporting ATPase ATPase C chain